MKDGRGVFDLYEKGSTGENKGQNHFADMNCRDLQELDIKKEVVDFRTRSWVLNARRGNYIASFRDYSSSWGNGCSELFIKRKFLTCTFCKFSCLNKSEMKLHQKLHTAEKPYVCCVCGYECTTRYRIVSHMRSHTGEKPYSCKICSAAFTTTTSLKHHLISAHHGEKLFTCSSCNYRTFSAWRLKSHSVIHTEAKPFRCAECDLGWARKSQLVVHIRQKHTGERPYGCPSCNFRCVTSRSMIVHLKGHVGEKPLKCKDCPFSTTTCTSLNLHISSTHF